MTLQFPQAPIRSVDTAAETGEADLRLVLTSIGETLYTWDVASDRITWGGNAPDTLRIPDMTAIATGRGFARLVAPEAGVSRFDTVMRAVQRDAGHGVAFQTTYAVRPPGGTTLWLEDTGRWFAGFDGAPVLVHGVVRVVQAPAAGSGAAPHADPLTGAMTRQQLADLLSDEIGRARKAEKTLGLALVGIEDLASLNESYGFEVADEAIAGIAARLRGVMRRGDALARPSGNKFAVVLMNCGQEQLGVAAGRFVEAVRSEPVRTAAGPVPAGVRLGAVLLPRFGQTAGQALQHAEEALADAKGAQATRSFHLYAPDRRRDERRQSNRRFTDEIVAALNERRVTLARQPVVAAGGRQVAFHEALVRVRGHDGRTMPAAQIVPAMERLGFVPLLDLRVLELVTAALGREQGAVLSMNVSRDTLRRPEWATALAAHVAARPEIARRLIVEITETSLVDAAVPLAGAIADMRGMGVRVAIDDFGSGHTSFRDLRDLGVDMVKLDGAFIQNLERSTDDRFFVRTLVDLARHLGLAVVAEWVQDEESARLLESWGIEYLQGELFGEAALGADAAEAAA